MAEKIHRNSLQPGYTLHWYQIEEILGQGGFGITYLASDTNLHTKVAIKEYLPIEMAVREGDHSVHPVTENHNKQFKWGLERFLTEARTLAKFNHPNIVRVLAVFEENNTGYMVMSYERGVSLAEKIRNRQTLEEQELTKLLIPLMGGLERMHDTGFIHRDIKPDNLFIREDGSPVLLDFGSARQSMVGETRTLTSLVTPGYAPFEQYYAKSDEQGPWTDIYGLGATMYRAVTGIAPADAVDRSNALLKRNNDTYIPCGEFVGDQYTERFLTAIDAALTFNVEDRPQSISEWRELFDLPDAPLSGARTDNIPTQPGTILRTFARPGKKQPTKRPTRQPTKRKDQTETGSGKKRATGFFVIVLLAGAAYFFLPQVRQQWINHEASQEIQQLVESGKQHLNAGRYIEPQGDNALHTFQKVLALQPDNAEARQGIQTIIVTIIEQARSAIQQQQFDAAEAMIARANQIRPGSAEAKLARNELQQARQAQEQFLQEEAERQEKIAAIVEDAMQVAKAGKITETLGLIENARSLKASNETIGKIKNQLVMTLESQAAIAAAMAKQHVKNNDTEKARQALADAKQIKSRLAELKLDRPEFSREDEIELALNTARVSADQGLISLSVQNLQKAKELGGSENAINQIRLLIRNDLEKKLEEQSALVKEAMNANNTRRAREALQKAKETRKQLNDLN